MTAFRRLITLTLLSLATTALLGQEAPVARTTEPVSAETDRDANDSRALRLSLNDAVATTVSKNLGIELQRFEHRIAGEEIRRQYQIFDPVADAALTLSSAEQTSLSSFAGGSRRGVSLDFGWNHFLPTGANYRLNFDNSRGTSSGPGVTFSPNYTTGLTFAASQPLMRDFGIDVNRRGINIARNTLGISRETFRDVLNDTALLVETAYLDLVYARRNVEVVKETLFLARDQSRITQIRIDVGASAPLDILQPRVQIAQTEETLIRAVASVREAEDRLRQLMNLPQSEWDRPIIPTDSFDYQAVNIDVAGAIERAYTQRPEVAADVLRTDNARINVLFAKNQVLPAVDFNIGYGLAGIAGRVLNPATGNPDPTVPSTAYTDALESIFSNDFPSWNVGLSFAMPLRNIGARAAARQAELSLEESRTSQELTRQNIAVEVRNAARDVDASARAISAARAAREAAESNVDAERKRYENGMTTNFQVLQVQQQLSDARRTELQALIGYASARARFNAATGDILAARGITTELPEVATEPNAYKFLDRYNWLNYSSRLTPEEQPK
ncbi:MAG TPA: TolC family protein [Thermoanaerobaculia bacterium]